MGRDIKLTYDDVMVVPETVTNIASRSECNPYDEYGMLPIFTAPMSTVVDSYNIDDFLDAKINVVLPRTVDYDVRLDFIEPSFENWWERPFVAMSMTEAREFFIDENNDEAGCHIHAERRETDGNDVLDNFSFQLVDAFFQVQQLILVT